MGRRGFSSKVGLPRVHAHTLLVLECTTSCTRCSGPFEVFRQDHAGKGVRAAVKLMVDEVGKSAVAPAQPSRSPAAMIFQGAEPDHTHRVHLDSIDGGVSPSKRRSP